MRVENKVEDEYIRINAKIEPVVKEVSRQEFEDFIESYPRPLQGYVSGISDPPIASYNDWELGWWPRSAVAHAPFYSDDPEDRYYCPPEERSYRIVTNYEELWKESQSLIRELGREL